MSLVCRIAIVGYVCSALVLIAEAQVVSGPVPSRSGDGRPVFFRGEALAEISIWDDDGWLGLLEFQVSRGGYFHPAYSWVMAGPVYSPTLGDGELRVVPGGALLPDVPLTIEIVQVVVDGDELVITLQWPGPEAPARAQDVWLNVAVPWYGGTAPDAGGIWPSDVLDHLPESVRDVLSKAAKKLTEQYWEGVKRCMQQGKFMCCDMQQVRLKRSKFSVSAAGEISCENECDDAACQVVE